MGSAGRGHYYTFSRTVRRAVSVSIQEPVEVIIQEPVEVIIQEPVEVISSTRKTHRVQESVIPTRSTAQRKA